MDAIALLKAVWDTTWVHAILLLMAADLVTGIAVALYTKTFAIGALGDWLLTRALPYILGDTVVQLVFALGLGNDTVVGSSGITTVLAAAVHTTVILALAGKLLDNLRQMGLAIPLVLTDQPKQQPPTTLST